MDLCLKLGDSVYAPVIQALCMQARRSIVRSSKSEDQLSGYEEVRAGPDQDESQRYFSPFDDPQFCIMLVSSISFVTSSCLPALRSGRRHCLTCRFSKHVYSCTSPRGCTQLLHCNNRTRKQRPPRGFYYVHLNW